ncbi:hypothetical protein BOTBODRAFT_39064 [Botryobasidium botryosum FD-172 SS1]|uniref:JmjC domain-containing protein n=1 Tax=Botryobasidium botryosum (strain FD-172 SS1) TaxID=930990 RepID=A0A067LVF2_BOTB1|nr:hypothetical protein BOTBODRAFT_39064 [Botryobasidium botryosum FD-172 SS1]
MKFVQRGPVLAISQECGTRLIFTSNPPAVRASAQVAISRILSEPVNSPPALDSGLSKSRPTPRVATRPRGRKTQPAKQSACDESLPSGLERGTLEPPELPTPQSSAPTPAKRKRSGSKVATDLEDAGDDSEASGSSVPPKSKKAKTGGQKRGSGGKAGAKKQSKGKPAPRRISTRAGNGGPRDVEMEDATVAASADNGVVPPISTQRRKGEAKSKSSADAGPSSELLYSSPGPSKPVRRASSQGSPSSSIGSVASTARSFPDKPARLRATPATKLLPGGWHYQLGACSQLEKMQRGSMAPLYCLHCRRRQAGDTCRFARLRALRKENDKFVETMLVSNEEEGEIEFPAEWNVEPEGLHLSRIKGVVAKALLPTLRDELDHIGRPGLIRRPREMECRATCDLCMTSIFSRSWMCKKCGRDICGDCYHSLCDCFSETAEAHNARMKLLVPVDASIAKTHRQRFTTCRRGKMPMLHPVEMWIPVSRFRPEELEETIRDMERAVGASSSSMEGIEGSEEALGDIDKEAEAESSQLEPSVTDEISVGDRLGESGETLGDIDKGLEAEADSSRFEPSVTNEAPVGDRLEESGEAVEDGEKTAEAREKVDGESPQNSSSAMEGIQVQDVLDADPAPSSPARIPAYAWPLPEAADNRMAFLDEATTWGWHWRGDEGAPTASAIPSTNILPNPSPSGLGLDALPTDPSGVPSLPITFFKSDELTEEIFQSHWSTGQPMVVTGLLPKFQIEWNPQYFIDHHGTQKCQVVDCQTDEVLDQTVGEFFSMFGVYGEDRAIYKLKDWPPQADFKKAFPKLYKDFSGAVPVPNYTRRDGVLNIAAHFPSNALAPDIGPKMYNAFESDEGPGGQGSTRLHMDMADAVNIMLHSSRRADGTTGTAAWDIFRAEDAGKIRQFLKAKFPKSKVHDPIHSQEHYLDSTLRQQLCEEYGVKSWRIYQRPGEAVFIPAGCAHQVCNLADCIKVAVDFVSPENVDRCERLTREFREQNQAEAWKEDVLQLRSMMWYAWLSCNWIEKRRATADAAL